MSKPVDDFYNEKIKLKDTLLKKTLDFLKSHDDLKGAFRHNLFTHDVEHAKDNSVFCPNAVKGNVVNDRDELCLRAKLADYNSWCPSGEILHCAIVSLSMQNEYHPIKDYLESITWDNVPRLDFWLTEICGVPITPYVQAVGRKLFVAMVKRIYEPGCQFDTLVVLEGAQGIYKSSLVRAIGGEYYAPIELNVNDRKNLVDVMRGKWVLEVEELAGFRKQELDRMKAFLSCPSDRVRLSYGRGSEDFKRQCVLIATYNPDADNAYLMDFQNRRFWPVRLPDDQKIKLEEFKEIRDQLFAEALILYRKGEPVYIEREEVEKIAQLEQEKRRSTDPWLPIIEDWISEKLAAHSLTSLETKQIAQDCLKIPNERITSRENNRIARVMKELGWIKFQESSGKRRYLWIQKPEALNDDWSE